MPWERRPEAEGAAPDDPSAAAPPGAPGPGPAGGPPGAPKRAGGAGIPSLLLFRAVLRGGSLEAVRLLLASGADVRATDCKGSSVMHFWARATAGVKQLMLVAGGGEELIRAGADPSAWRQSDGMSPLHHVCARQNHRRGWLSFHKALFLLRRGADPEARTRRGQLPQDMVAAEQAAGPARPRQPESEHLVRLLALARSDSPPDNAWPGCGAPTCSWREVHGGERVEVSDKRSRRRGESVTFDRGAHEVNMRHDGASPGGAPATRAMAVNEKARFDVRCSPDSSTEKLSAARATVCAELLASPWELLTAFRKVQGVDPARGPVPGKSAASRAANDDVGDRRADADRISQLPEYRAREAFRTKDRRLFTSLAIKAIDKTHRENCNRIFDILTEMRSVYTVIEDSTSVKNMARLVEVMHRALGPRWPSPCVCHLGLPDPRWKHLGDLRFGEPDERGKIAELIHVLGARVAVSKKQNATDRDSFFMCFARLGSQSGQVRRQFAGSSAKALKHDAGGN
ncbi:unnamed protein product [Prorocentrum cordatum]|uniref:Uncharacterized protein n=1 Tax=Prorocentrum cordatum TaxID=2364126 RepID=A0ABN9WAR7_9DINO|nr:unnamed protein product [Polarella glacialis]